MVEKDTIRLLRECDSGVKMGIASINDVMKYTENGSLKRVLDASLDKHTSLSEEIESALRDYSDEGKNPNPIIKGMSWMKTNMKLAMNESDKTIADLMTDGCNMGIKSLSKYLNQYASADERSKDIAKRVIKVEEKMSVDMRDYL